MVNELTGCDTWPIGVVLHTPGGSSAGAGDTCTDPAPIRIAGCSRYLHKRYAQPPRDPLTTQSIEDLNTGQGGNGGEG